MNIHSFIKNKTMESLTLSKLLLLFYKEREKLIELNNSMRSLKSSPVTFKNQTDVGSIERVIKWNEDVTKCIADIEQYTLQLEIITDKIISNLNIAGVGTGHKIEVPQGSNSILEFWIDNNGEVNYNGPISV